jgi:acyl-CoA synthetase (AMP-forming)/AMP-acid ligase II
VSSGGNEKKDAHSLGLPNLLTPTPVEKFEEHSQLRSDTTARLIILTTGTTGQPKGAVYSWQDLASQAKVKPQFQGTRWLLAYNLNHFAGIQMVNHVLFNAANLVIPHQRDMPTILKILKDQQVEYVSATPTFWRVFLTACRPVDAEELELKHITIGGEAVTQEILVGLRDLLPDTAISQVYATTEVGSCFSVRDGERGFPASLLDRAQGNVKLKVIDGELYVRSTNSMIGYVESDIEDLRGSWHATGDLVRIEGDRVIFMGRKSELINVGGVKVHPLEVEEAILELPQVQTVRVHGRPNPITGRAVVADIVPAGDQDEERLKELVRKHCATRLDRYSWPRLIRIVPELPKSNQKLIRHGSL